MTPSLRVLIIEDSESDAELMIRFLKRAGFHPVYEQVQSSEEMRQALNRQEWDILLCDYSMPNFDAFAALQILQSDGRDIPFIVVSGAIGEDTAVAIMKAGAHDYLMKDNLARLIPAIQRELREAEVRREKRNAQKALMESLVQYRFLFDNMVQGVIYQDAEGRILSANPAAERILGLSRDQILKLADTEYSWKAIRGDGSHFPTHEYPANQVFQTGQAVRDVVMGIFNPHDNDYRWISVNAVPQFLPGSHTPYRVFATFDDITALKKAEKERLKLEAQLRQAQKMEAIGQLAGGVAHDFNNLLYVITGYVEMIMEELTPQDPLYRQIEQIMKAAQKGATLVRQLLLFSRKEAMQPKLIDLNELIGNLLKMIRRMIGEHITLEVHPGFNLKPIFADPGQIEQVLMNLCVNARDAMPEGGRIGIETENITIGTEFCQQHPWSKPGDYILLTVSDTGCGIPKEIQDRVFEPFFTTKEVGKGTGLGLSAVYGIIKSHQGMIHLYSEPGHGTLFKIYIPSAEKQITLTPHEKAVSKIAAGRNELLLIAEDEDAVRNVLADMLEHDGYRVLLAQDGDEAIRLFDKHRNDIQLALLDVIMPKASGQKVLEHIKAQKPDMPVMFLTGYSKGMLPQNLSLDRRYEIIQKPVSRASLLQKIREVLDNRLKFRLLADM